MSTKKRFKKKPTANIQPSPVAPVKTEKVELPQIPVKQFVIVANPKNVNLARTLSDDKKVGEVYSTTDLNQFCFVEGNRSTEPYAELVDSMRKSGRNLQPILVDIKEKFVIDGQTRLKTAMLLQKENPKFELWYIFVSGYTLEQIRELQTAKAWSHKNIAGLYAVAAESDELKQSYEYYNAFTKQFPGILSNMLLSWLTGTYNNNVSTKITDFKSGKLLIKKEQYELAVKEATMYHDTFVPYFPYWKRRNLMIAYFTLIKTVKGFKPEQLKEQMAKHPDLLLPREDVQSFIKNLVQIYNRGKHNNRIEISETGTLSIKKK